VCRTVARLHVLTVAPKPSMNNGAKREKHE
jgi:hypothetical protein